MFVDCGVPGRADDKQIHLQVGGKPDDVAHRVPDQNMGMYFHAAVFRQRASAL
jgi:hypothetical protein